MIITTKVKTVYDNDPWIDPTEAIKYYIDGQLCHIDVMGRYKGLSRIYDKPIYIITFTDGSTFGPFKSPIFSVSYSEKNYKDKLIELSLAGKAANIKGYKGYLYNKNWEIIAK